MPYPTGTEVAAWMVAQGLLSAAPGDLSAVEFAADAAATAWEGATGWVPFLAGDSETRVFDGPEGFTLFPEVGVLSISSLSIDGAELVADEDYFLQHRRRGGPYQSIEFNGYVAGARRAISVTGVFGYAAELPADVLQAIYAKAAADAIANPGFQGAVKREKAGPVEKEYAASDAIAASPAGRLLSLWEDAVKRWRKL